MPHFGFDFPHFGFDSHFLGFVYPLNIPLVMPLQPRLLPEAPKYKPPHSGVSLFSLEVSSPFPPILGHSQGSGMPLNP